MKSMKISGLKKENLQFEIFEKEWFYFFSLLVLGCIIRFWGINYGLPSVYNSTEYYIAKHALSLGARHTIEPLYYVYPTAYTYLIAVLYSLYFVFGYLIGWFPTTSDFAIQFLVDPSTFYLLGRCLNAIVFIIAIIIIYKTARIVLNLKFSFLISLIFISCYNMFEFSFWMVPDIFLVLGTTIILYYIIKSIFKDIKTFELIFASLICGLTISMKYNAGFLAVGWLINVWNVSRKMSGKPLIIFFTSAFIIILGFLIGTPYWLFKFKDFFTGFSMIISQSKYAYNFETGIPYFWELKKILISEWILGFVFVLFMILILLKVKKENLSFLLIVFPTFLLVGSWEKKGLDYLLIIFPTLIVFIIYWLHNTNKQSWFYRGVTILLMSGILLNLPRILYGNYLHSQMDTRKKTGQWIMNNYKPGTKICYDHYHYDIDIIDINRFLDYGAGSRILDSSVKEKLQTMKETANNYQMISPNKKISISEVSEDLLIEVKYDSFVVHNILNPHKTLEEIVEEGTELLILNSYTYQKFQLNPIPSYQNPMRSDFITRRNFYNKVLDSLTPIRILEPDNKTPGPVIKIFDLKKKDL
jgi:hypothetical protein